MLSIILCCAALFAVSNALPTGAPLAACDNLIPGNPPHGEVEQATPNPWMIDLSDFDFNATINMYTYNPGGTYNSKLKVYVTYSHSQDINCVTYGSCIHVRKSVAHIILLAYNILDQI